ncbi:MAG: hypothetical protein E7012_05320 [Alphaproteobacteria bacterium]|nr:hypothetical protein [Alphaproteobacteria bacterium]
MESFFKFEITQTTKVLLYKIKNGHDRRWIIEGDVESSFFSICELGNKQNKAQFRVSENKIVIITAHGYEYQIVDKPKDGAKVLFHGPVNALLTQSLIPRMTYVPTTLVGKTNEMEDFVCIEEFMILREERHGDNVNPQDQHGWKVNMKFCNELYPWLPMFRESFRMTKKQRRQSGKFKRRSFEY